MTRAMVLAAGVGSRLDPISQHIPKPLVPVLNTPVISHILHLLHDHGIREVIANTHYLASMLTGYFDLNPFEGMSIEFLHEDVLSGDAGGVRTARSFLENDTFLVIMGDLITNADISDLIQAHKRKKALATIGIKKMKDVTRFGVLLRDEQGFIKAFQEKPKADEAISNEISTGIYVLEPRVFDYIPKDGVYGFGRQLFPHLVSLGLPVLGHELQGYWSDIGTLDDLFKANMDSLSGKIKLAGPALANQKNFPGVQIGKNVLIGENTIIDEGSEIRDRCIIGERSYIGRNVHLENCLVFPDAKIPAGTQIKNCIFAFDELIPISALALHS